MTPMTAAVAASLPQTPALIDPLAPAAVGSWHGERATVRRITGLEGARVHVRRRNGRLLVEHRLTADELCDGLAALIAEELSEAGLLSGQADFEEVFTGLVRSTVADPLDAWLTFYRNSVDRLENGAAGFSPIHRFAADLVEGPDVIDLGSCFGFLPLRLAKRGFDVLATDLSAPTMDLLSRMCVGLDRPVRTLPCDAAGVPLPDGSAATVTAVHLLEHLPATTSAAVIAEALRLARRRVVIAVPFEERPTACYGHVQQYTAADLHRMAAGLGERYPGLRVRVVEHHGGWLIADR